MNETSLTLPFITRAADHKEELSYSAELACIVFLAESQRKKTSLLRDKPEKIAYIAKLYYPYWIAPIGNESVIIDGLNNTTHEISFQEPTKIAFFIEELKKNAFNPLNFANTLQAQAKEVKEFTSKVHYSFPSLLDDPELLTFFLENFRSGAFRLEKLENQTQIPVETDWKTALQTTSAFMNCMRTIQADSKGLQFALRVLGEEMDFHKNASDSEVAVLKEKCEQEVAALKPAIDERVEKLVQKRDKTLSTLQKSIDRRMATLDRKRERIMRKLMTIEQRKDAAQRRVNNAKKKSSSAGSFALKKYEKDIDKTKNEIKSVSKEIDELKKEGNSLLKLKEEEFQKAIIQEESQLTRISAAFISKSNAKQKQIDDMTAQTVSIASSLESQIDQLKRDSFALRSQVVIGWKTETSDELTLAQLPVYLVKYTKGEEERLMSISPLVVAEETSVLNGLKKMLALNPEPKLKTITRSLNKRLHETLTANVAERLQSDPEFKRKINEVCRVNNLIDQNTFASTLNEGLDEIEKKGWMTSLEAQATCKRVMGEEV